MNVAGIKEAVRLCIDEEAADISNLNGVDANDCTYMDNIITGKIPAALRWITLYAPAETLSGVSSSSSDDNESESETTPGTIDIVVEESHTLSAEANVVNNLIEPDETLIRVVRVKHASWHRAILGDSLIKEDSDEYLQLRDDNGAAATIERPQAALINTKKKAVEVWPATIGVVKLTYIRALTDADLSGIVDETTVNLPVSVETSFIYYLAYLVCCAYGDGRAKSMFEIATMNLGKTDDKQRQ